MGTCGLFVPVSWTQREDSIPLKNWVAPMYWRAPAVDESGGVTLIGAADSEAAKRTVERSANTLEELVFVAVQPCRPVDTRGQSGAFGPPIMGSGGTRDFPVSASTKCSGLPANVKAYSLNVTVVPSGPLSFLTLWPTGSPKPLVSTLNSLNGGIAANAAIVPAGTGGSVSVFVTNLTQVIIDLNGVYVDETGGGGPTGPTGATGRLPLCQCPLGRPAERGLQA